MMTVEEEYNDWKDKQYGSLSLEDRQELGAFYTPPELSIKMVNMFETLEPGKTLLDPTCGAGGLLAAAILMGKVNPEDCYGIELEPKIVKICQDRLEKLGVPRDNIRQGDALDKRSYEQFFDKYAAPEVQKSSFLKKFGNM